VAGDFGSIGVVGRTRYEWRAMNPPFAIRQSGPACARAVPAHWLLAALNGMVVVFSSGSVSAQTANGPAQPPPAVFTNAQQVLVLGIDGARRSVHPVMLTGTVTLPLKNQPWVYVQDATAGVLVIYTNTNARLEAGQRVVVTGRTYPAQFAVHVSDAQIRVLGRGGMPEPKRPDPTRLATGEDFGTWVALEGRVVDVYCEGPTSVLMLASKGHRFFVMGLMREMGALPGGAEPPLDWLDARVEVQGVCWTEVDRWDRPYSFRIHTPGTNFVTRIEPGARDVFARPVVPIRNLRAGLPPADPRVKVLGTATHWVADQVVFLEDETGAIRARLQPSFGKSAGTRVLRDRAYQVDLEPGDRVEVIGHVVLQGTKPMLTDAEYRKVGRGTIVKPAAISPDGLLPGANDHRLVSVKTRLLDQQTRVWSGRAEEALVLLAGDTQFQATLRTTETNVLPKLPRGALLEVAGICTIEPGTLAAPGAANLLMRSPADVLLLRNPLPWDSLQPGRILAVSGGLGAVALAWIWTLRRQVRRRTTQLQAANEELKGEVEERKHGEIIQRAVYQISTTVHGVEDLKSLYARIHEVVRSVMQAENFFLLLHNPATDQHEYVYHVDQMDPWPKPRKVSNGLVGHILQTGRSLRVDRQSMIDPDSPWRYVSGTPSAVWLGVPLTIRGETIGVLAVQDYHNSKTYSEEDERILTYMATQVALAIEGKRAAEELARFAAIAGVTSDFMGFADMEQRVRFINAAGRRMLGLSPDEPLDKMMVKDIYPAWAYQKITDTILPAALRDGAWSGEIAILRRDGTEVPVSMVGVVPRNQAGLPAFMSAVMRDISERKQIETDMQRALAHEKELSELKSRFVSMVSHEFRTPLGIIMGSAEILEAYLDRLPPAERHANLKDILQSAGHMARLMEEVLLLGRVEAGKMACRRAALDLAAFCARMVEEADSAAAGRCPIRLRTPPNLPPTQADESLLRHIFSNLLSNAVKYSSAGSSVEFVIEARDDHAVFTVRDQGLGIPPEDQRQLFQAFHRGRNVGDTQGTGLGMVIVKHCVELHGGRISFESREDHGTTFTVELPLFSPPPARSASAPSSGLTEILARSHASRPSATPGQHATDTTP
jgi:PAS domain S-box-containing protein